MIRRLLDRLSYRLNYRQVTADAVLAGAQWENAWIIVRRRWHRPLLIRLPRRDLAALGRALADSHLECCGTPQTITPTRQEP